MIVPDSDAVLAAAHAYAKKNWRVIPLHTVTADGACTCGRQGCNSVGKHPIASRWQDTPAMGGADIQATFDDGNYNVGIATGDPSGFWVLDLDFDKDGTEERWRALVDEHDGDELPPTYMVKTGGGGYQAYFAMPDFQVTNSAKRLPSGVDVRGTGGQVVAPPSVSGKGPYVVVREAAVLRAPEWLEELVRPLPPAAPVDLETLPKLTDLPEAEQLRLRKYTDDVVKRELARLEECKKIGWGGPGWNDTTYAVSCSLLELANSPWCPLPVGIAHQMVMENAPRDAGFDQAAVDGCFASALKTVAGKGRALPPNRGAPTGLIFPGDPLSDPSFSSAGGPATPSAGETSAVTLRAWNDLGNAHRMVDLYGDRLRWVEQADNWAVYRDGAWSLAGKPAARALVQEMLEGMVEREGSLYSAEPEGDDGDKPSQQELFVKWAHSQQMSARISAALQECTGRPELQASMVDFDSQPFLLNCANGVVDLTTGELLPHDPALLLMLQSPVSYVPDAPAPRWEAFLRRCLPDADVRTYLQKTFGYSLTGSMAEQSMFIHHGSGANGKSVFLVIASHIAGSYGQVVPRETLLAKGSGNSEHPTSVARMRGKRFLQASETAAGRRLDEETVKGLTGGEEQTARFMGADFFDFTPTGKIHFVTNHLPRLTDAESIWRRLHLIAWREVIPVAERNSRLAEEIITHEAEGVLAWAVRGVLDWKPGDLLVEPASMKTDIAAYRTDQDLLGEFIGDRLEVDLNAFAAMSDIYGAYQAWCFNSGIKSPLTSPDLARALRERKFEDKRTGKARGFRARLLPVPSLLPSDPLVSA